MDWGKSDGIGFSSGQRRLDSCFFFSGRMGNHKVQSSRLKVEKMADILEEIVAHKRIEIEQRKRFIQPRQMISLTEQKMQENEGR